MINFKAGAFSYKLILMGYRVAHFHANAAYVHLKISAFMVQSNFVTEPKSLL